VYLCYWMRQSGLADPLPSLREAVYVGLSAGSMVMAPNIGEDFVRWKMGRRHAGAVLRDRRSDRHQSDRWCRRGRLRGALETVHSPGPRALRQEIGVRMLVHPWVCNADMGCGAETLRCATVPRRPGDGCGVRADGVGAYTTIDGRLGPAERDVILLADLSDRREGQVDEIPRLHVVGAVRQEQRCVSPAVDGQQPRVR
jgi:hypothetical protein